MAEGIDPITGEVLPPDRICNNLEIIRALYTILRQEKTDKKKKTYESSGKRWTTKDDQLLKQLFEQGVKVSELQKKFIFSLVISRIFKISTYKSKEFS